MKFFYKVPPLFTDLAPIAAGLSLPFYFMNVNYLYDPMTILLSTLMLLTLVARSKWYWPVFVLCCINKETSILFSLLYVVYQLTYHGETSNRKDLFLKFAAHWVIWLPIKVGISWLYIHNRGQIVEWTWMYNIELFQTPARLVSWGSITSISALLCSYKWKSKPLFLRRGFITLGIPLIAVTTLLGIFDELRAFYEIYPIFFLLVYPTLLALAEAYRSRFMAKGTSPIYCEPAPLAVK